MLAQANITPPGSKLSDSDLDDLRLIKIYLKAKVKNQFAFETILKKHKAKIRALIYKILHNTSEVDDVFQIASFKLCKKIHKFKRQSKFTSWLFIFVQREALMWVRNKKCPKNQATSSSSLVPEIESQNWKTDVTPESIYSAKERLIKLITNVNRKNSTNSINAYLDIYCDKQELGHTAKKYRKTLPAIKSKIFRIKHEIARFNKVINCPHRDENDLQKVLEIKNMILSAVEFKEKMRALKESEADIIQDALSKTANNKNQAAKLLGLKRTTLLAKIKKMNGIARTQTETNALSLLNDETITDEEKLQTRKVLRLEIKKFELQLKKLQELERHYEAMDYISELEKSNQPDKAFDVKLEEIQKGYQIGLT